MLPESEPPCSPVAGGAGHAFARFPSVRLKSPQVPVGCRHLCDSVAWPHRPCVVGPGPAPGRRGALPDTVPRGRGNHSLHVAGQQSCAVLRSRIVLVEIGVPLSETGPEVAIRDLRPEDLPFVVDQHLHHFPDGFFARLGRAYLTEYYLSYCTDHSSCAVVATVGAEPIGYLVGDPDPVGHRQHVISAHGRTLTKLGLLALVRNPPLAANFVRTRGLRYVKRLLVRSGRAPAVSASTRRAAVLHYMAVVPDQQRRGTGRALIAAFEDKARQAGCQELVLVTHTGGSAMDFYRRSDWAAVDEHRTPDGAPLTTFTKPVIGHELASGRDRSTGSVVGPAQAT